MTYSRHGWHIPGTIKNPEEAPLDLPRPCGGPSMCALCMLDAHNALRTGPIVEIPVSLGDQALGTGKIDPSGGIYLDLDTRSEVVQQLLESIDLGVRYNIDIYPNVIPQED